MVGDAYDDLTTALVESAATADLVSRPLEPKPEAEAEAPPPDKIDRYEIEGVLGRGGMGVVYAAHDPKLNRPVALKVMRPKPSDPVPKAETEARLLREAQAIASLSHPNIVEVFDFGRVGGEVYMAMELLSGQSMRSWLDGSARPVREVLEVMLPAGRGLSAAHDHGVVHRDFKPANILIGDDGRVKVLDFGLARAAAFGDLSEDGSSSAISVHRSQLEDSLSGWLPEITQAGAVMGTPAYMAPEQAVGEPVDARSDQFSYCITLHEAVYGVRPFEGGSRRERLRAARLGRVRAAPKGSAVPVSLRRVLLRGLDPDPRARWPSMATLLGELERAVARRRWGAPLALVVLGCVGAAAALTVPSDDRCEGVTSNVTDKWNESSRARMRAAFEATGESIASDTWSRVEVTAGAYVERWTEARRSTCERAAAGARVDRHRACLQRRAAEIGALVEVFEEADVEVVRRAVQIVAGLGSIEACERVGTGADPSQKLAPESAEEVAELREELASLSVFRGSHRYARALEVGASVVEKAEALDDEPLLAEALYRHGQTQEKLGEFRVASRTLERAFYLALSSGHDVIAADASSSLFFLYGYRLSDPQAAAQWSGHAESAVTRSQDEKGRLELELLRTRGTVALRRARFEPALAHLEAAVALAREQEKEDSLDFAELLSDVGIVQLNLGDFEAAKESFEAAHDLSTRHVGPGHPTHSAFLNNLGNVEQALGRHDASLKYFEESYEIDAEVFGQAHVNTAMGLNNVGTALLMLDRDEEAIGQFERSIAAYESADFDALDLARPVGNLGYILTTRERIDEGIAYLLRAVQLIEEQEGPHHADLSGHWLNLGSAYAAKKQTDEALVAMNKALDVDEAALGPDHPYLAQTLASIAGVHIGRGRYDEAQPLLERALKIQSNAEVDPVFRAATKVLLAQTLWEKELELDRTRTLLREAKDALEKAGTPGQERLGQLQTWLTKHPEALGDSTP